MWEAVALNSDFIAAIFFSVLGIGSAAPMLLPGAMTMWRHDKAMRAPADQARDLTKAIVGRDVLRSMSRILRALSALPPIVSIDTTTAVSPDSSARSKPRRTRAAWLPSISPEMTIARTESAA